MDAYYGPTKAARSTINARLDLAASGAEQDWEIELADAAKLHRMVDLLEGGPLEFEERSAWLS